jgi:hypothetical protein
MYADTDYYPTQAEEEALRREELAEIARLADERQAREELIEMLACEAIEREEERELAQIAAPVAAAVSGWLRSVAAERRAA